MLIGLIKFGEVVCHDSKQVYGKVVGLKADEVHHRILLEIQGNTDCWDPDQCRSLTNREKGEDMTVFQLLETVVEERTV